MDTGTSSQVGGKSNRKAAANKNDPTRISRRRHQNRISQRCVREKQQAHKKQLEMFVDMIKSRNEIPAQGNLGQADLLDAHIALIEENKKLKDALMEMRKKLMSLSNVASEAADSDIIHEILQTRKGKRDTSERSMETSSSRVQRTGSPESDLRAMNAPEGEPLNAVDESVSRSANLESAIVTLDNGTSHSDATTGLERSAVRESDELVVRDAVNSAEPLQLFDFDFDFTMFDVYPPLLPSLNIGQISSNEASDDRNSFRAIPCDFISKIEKACLRYIAQTIELPESVAVGRSPSTQLSIEERSAQCISDVAAIAVYLLTVFSGLDTYIYRIGSDVPFERIMRWRINPTYQNRVAIPDPFRPTPFQYNLLNHPIAIDFIPSSSIRDQLILKANDCDLDRIIQDILLHTVVEIPQHQVALATLDVYTQSILPKDKTHEFENWEMLAPSWSLF
ncbi:hypothetical protein BU16DRAFT_563755 [Lophium mytilinum]|uniref:BZIP domain-containing protein n=1 Tax=Lophium mytilinum TaxID=390894 RepID=A0A6A6QN97_9PEZI|nr:hypothetical protein BU16DRAFT_563755 [Lophium mytilinum]